MAFLVIDTDSTSLNYEQTTQLDGFEYLFGFVWSERESCWYVSMSDQDGTPIAQGIRLVVTWPLLRRFKFNPQIPTGQLMCIDLSGQNVDIQEPSDLGSRVLLVYVTADDVAAVPA
jgi:hypothetical protein